MKKIRIGAFFLAAFIGISTLAGCGNSATSGSNANNSVANSDTSPNHSSTNMREITTTELVQDMGLGINLGNTFESAGSWIGSDSVTNYEMAWGSPQITEKMIKGYAEAGFGVMRVPVAWSNMMAEDYTINPEYLARVKEVIDWTLDTGMYVIMNIHWDGGWWEKFPTDKENCMKKYKSIWTQLTAAFKDYGDYLMFESLNEEGCWNDVWNRYGGTKGKEDAYGLLNEINQTFVDIVRGSGGNNEKRHLLIAGYATDVELTCDEMFKMPTDEQNRCAISVHYYTPATFCILEKDADWGKARTTWGTDADIAELEKNVKMMKETFADKGVPVIIGEYGVTQKNKTPEMVRKYVTTVCEAFFTSGFCPVLWDTTDDYYDRILATMPDKELKQQFDKIAAMSRS